MPDVSRSNSQYSDSSRPRVSFNRDVHVKRFGAPSTPRVPGALTGDGERRPVPLAIHREDPSRLSRRELAEQVKRVLADADSVKCVSQSLLDPKPKKSSTSSAKKFNTLPPLRNKRHRHSKANHSFVEESQSSSPERSASREPRKHFKSADNSVDEGSHLSSEKDNSKVNGGKRFTVPSVFASLDRSERKKNKKQLQNEHKSSKLSKNKNNSSSLTDLADSASSARIAENNKKRRHAVKRSISDVGTRKPDKYKKAGLFLSIDRLTARKSKNKNSVVHSDYSDVSPAYPRKNILKKSHSDSESVPLYHNLHSERHKKKQLSPIIEVTQKDDYFHRNEKVLDLNSSKAESNNKRNTEDTMLHSSQLPADKPVLTRGQKVDLMVKKLSQEEAHIRGPPRGISSTAVLVTPEHSRQHNNNLPFSYTEPTLQRESRSPTRDSLHKNTALAKVPTATGDGQVIYAEVVVSGGGNGGGALNKQTVHTKVPTSDNTVQLHQEDPINPNLHNHFSNDKHFQEPSNFSQQEHTVKVKVSGFNQHTSDDEGLGLSMDHGGYRRSSLDYIEEGREYYNGGNTYKKRDNRLLSKNDDDDGYWYESSQRDFTSEYDGGIRKEYQLHETKHRSSNHIISSSERGRADGMDSRKKDLLLSESYRSRYDSGLYNHNDDTASPPLMRKSKDGYRTRENFTTEFASDSRIIPPGDDVSYRNYIGGDEKDILSRSIDSNDLSLRRNRLESRIESQMKDRFVSTKYNSDRSDSKTTDSNRKHISNINLNSRQEFLNSQLSSGKNSPYHDPIQQKNVKNIAMKSSYSFASSRTHDFDSYNKKDLLADSGIEIDYRIKDPAVSNKKYENRTPSNEHLTPKIQTTHHKVVNKPSVDSYQHVNDDDQETDENYNHHNIVNHHKSSYHHKTKSNNSFTSTQLIREQKHSEAIPTSTVLIRHWAPSAKDGSPPSKHKTSASEKDNWKKDSPPSEEEYSDYEKTPPTEAIKENSKPQKKLEEKDKHSNSKEPKQENKKVQKKKPTSTMDKVKQLFSRNDKSKKNKKKEEKVKVTVENVAEEEDILTSRYREYKGSDMELDDEHPKHSSREKYQRESNDLESDRERISRSSHKNNRPLESDSPRSSPRDRAHYRSNTMLDEDTVQKGLHSPKPTHRRKNPKQMEEEDEPAFSHRNNIGSKYHKSSAAGEHKEVKQGDYHPPTRQRLATPSPSPSPIPQRPYNKSTSATLNRINNKNKEQHGGSWFKSLDRLGKRNKKTKEQEINEEYEDDPKLQTNSSNSSKNLRFFGDTDQESVASAAQHSKHAALRRYKANTSTSGSSSHNRLKVPSRNAGPRHHRSAGDMATSSAESTTEGDSSQQSQRSVYLHAATVGDIPGPPKSRTGVARRAQSREELSSTAGSSRLQPRTRTVSRSVSVLAPWKPRHYKEGLELHYSNDTSSKTLGRPSNGKPPKVPTTHNSNSTMNRSSGASKYKNDGEKSKEDNQVQQKHAKKAMSVESLSQKNAQIQSQHSRSRTNLDKKQTNSSASVESLSHRRSRDKETSSRNHSRMNNSTMEINSSGSKSTPKKGSEATSQRSSSKVSRSASMPKDSRSAGWFKLRNKKQGT